MNTNLYTSLWCRCITSNACELSKDLKLVVMVRSQPLMFSVRLFWVYLVRYLCFCLTNWNTCDFFKNSQPPGLLCLCVTRGHTNQSPYLYVCTHTSTPQNSGFCSLKADQVLRAKNHLVIEHPTVYGNMSSRTGPPPSIKPVQSSLACKVWLNPSLWLNHRPPGQIIKQEDSDHSLRY